MRLAEALASELQSLVEVLEAGSVEEVEACLGRIEVLRRAPGEGRALAPEEREALRDLWRRTLELAEARAAACRERLVGRMRAARAQARYGAPP